LIYIIIIIIILLLKIEREKVVDYYIY